MLLAEIPFPLIDPDLVQLGPLTVRWYGLTYLFAFAAAFFVLRDLARRGRWPVEPEKVADVLFWGILGVFVGGRLGWVLFYGIHDPNWKLTHALNVWEGGMSFHGGLLGVIVAYLIYCRNTKTPLGEMFDGLTLATPLGIFFVRCGNFINAELYGRPWDGAWAMRFPLYERYNGPANWAAERAAGRPDDTLFSVLSHPSQLYEGFGEGLLMFFLLRWLMLKKGVGGGRIAATFLVGYGAVRFLIEFVRKPDQELGLAFLGIFTRGQQLCLGMILAGLIVFAVIAVKAQRERPGATTG